MPLSMWRFPKGPRLSYNIEIIAMKRMMLLLLPSLVWLNESCRKETDSTLPAPINGGDEWLIPRNRVVDGGPGKDGIPALATPVFTNVDAVGYLSDDDLVIGYRNGNDIRAYPHAILNWHEIVNDDVSGDKIAIIYCPLTGTASCWSRMLAIGETSFGVSGLLYNSNVIPYDRATNSNWSQLLSKSVNGSLSGTEAENIQVIETTWKTWKEFYPNSKVLSTSTGFSRNYTTYPYGDYRTNNNSLIFSVDPDDSRLPRKERVLGVIRQGKARVYRFASLENAGGVINEEFEGLALTVAGDQARNIIVAFERKLPDNTVPEFTVDGTGQGLLRDQFGNVWDAFGVALSGPLRGQRLRSPLHIMGYWMAFGSFYPGAEIR